jgi:propionyl-CoA synthetase
MGTNMLNQDIFGPVFPTLPGSVTKVLPGWDVRILDEQNKEVPRNKLGKVCIKIPMPPSHTMTIWGNDERYVSNYLTENPGYYVMGDEGMIDSRGYLHILSRIDDVINVAGHRLDTGRIEEAINHHRDVAESAVIGLNDQLKG